MFKESGRVRRKKIDTHSCHALAPLKHGCARYHVRFWKFTVKSTLVQRYSYGCVQQKNWPIKPQLERKKEES